MANRTWDVDEDAEEWKKMRRKNETRENWKTISVSFENKRGFVKLTKEEWKILQDFVDVHNPYTITLKDYEHLPPKVRIIVHDWRRV